MAARPRQVSDEDILEAAAACFLEHGPSVSTQIIADRIGLSQPALFKRFGTKQDLMISSLMPPERPVVVSWIQNGPSGAPLNEQLDDLVQRLWAMVCHVLPRISLLTSSGISPAAVAGRFKRFPMYTVIEALAGWLSRAAAGRRATLVGDPIWIAQASLGMLQGRALLRVALDGFVPAEDTATGERVVNDDDGYLALISALLWRAICPEERRDGQA